MRADQSTMPPLFDADVVSPELALVDPELAARARAALPPRRGRRVPARPLPAVAVAPASRRGRRFATPASIVLATAAATTIVTAFTGFEHAQGEPPRAVGSVETVAPVTARAAPADSPADASTLAPSDAAATASSSPSSPTASGRVGGAGGRTPATPAASPKVGGVATPEAPAPPALSGTTLVWDEAGGTAAYDVELRRGGTVIYSSTSTAPEAVVPRSWKKDGTAFVLQPEDQLYVWPVGGGRRASPVVDGALAMDTTDIARFIEQSQSRQP